MKDIVGETEIWVYVSQRADKATRAKVENWKTSNDFDEELFNSIVKLYKITGRNPFDDTISIEEEKTKFFEVVAPTNIKSLSIQKYLKYAAVVMLFISIIGIIYQNFSRNIITVETGYGEERQVALLDGSTVWLNARSKISYEEDAPRTIQLDGEAFFEVAKDKANPFTVETPDKVIVKALGTSFNVKAYPENSYLETTLLTGKVEVSSADYFEEKIIMLPNDNIRIIKADGIPIKTTIQNKKTVLAWRAGKIRFENMPFKDIADDLDNQLNIKLVFENEAIAESRFTAVFDKSTPMEEILEVLNTSKNFEYNLNQETNEWMIK
ncbi:FecR family protein [Flavobacterium litorale]|uniref:FecR domain-containing protein n=1 Tax=Flavobacterium litorale TaxID=2856519 RepID=A0ABX8VCL2_9FLAO|nr:FecR domain-containing protein [Flavobacterium litorale]QYJ68394.1 FecR domain-containing protein [Flavobacterium litorale]